MNVHTLNGNWNELKGKAKQQWGKLTDDQLEQIDGKRDELVGKVQQAYGKSIDEAQKEVDEFERRSVS